MLNHGRIPLTNQEHDTIEKLLANHDGGPVTLTRRDPGETGPILAHAGDDTYQVDGAKAKKVRKHG
jgi:hypothetical protein